MSSVKDREPDESSSLAGDIAEREAREIFERLDLFSYESRSYFERLRQLTDEEDQPVFIRLYHSSRKWNGEEIKGQGADGKLE